MQRTCFQSILLVLLVTLAFAAQSSGKKPAVVNEQFGDDRQTLTLAFDLVLDSFQLKSNSYLVLTPVVKSNQSADSLELAAVVVMGKNKAKVLERTKVLTGKSPLPDSVMVSLVRTNNKAQSYSYRTEQALAKWMYNASMIIRTEMKGCADCDEALPESEGENIDSEEAEDAEYGQDTYLVSNRILIPPVYYPQYRLSFIEPEPEPVKTRSDRHTASFSYVVNRAELRRDFGTNASEFEKVDQVIEDIVSNPNYDITEFWIAGYASPEGNFDSNKSLAQNRANSFADYIVGEYNIDRSLFKIDGYGEDWMGLQALVEQSDMEQRQAILDIIQSVENPDARDQRIIRLDNGASYKFLLNELYPLLRRTEYAIAYTVRGFNVEEARQIIQTEPELLSLNEMYLVANSYEAKSEDFNRVMAISAGIYPESEVAILNSAAARIEIGLYEEAIRLMETISKKDLMWNNLAVAYAHLGNINRAREMFRLAGLQGDENAAYNLEELEKSENPY